MEQLTAIISENPLFVFTLLLLVSLSVPPIFERLRLPGLVGLLAAGVLLGPSGLQLLTGESETMKLLAEIGKIYLMFVAGLEIDLDEFRKTRDRSLGFGAATFLIPLIAGALVGRAFGFGWNGSILIGSLLASHTLLAYPIVQRLGATTNQAVTVTIGATIFTDIGALLVLAICVSIHAGEFSPTTLIVQLVSMALYCVAVLLGLDRAGKAYFHRTGDEEGNQFLFILVALFLAAVGAQIINMERIVGAFLAGLAVNDVVGRGPVEEKVEFVGSVLFVPFFFIDMGLLLDIPAFLDSLTSNLGLTLAVVVVLLSSKFLAALVAKVLYRYRWTECLTMWSLSLPQVAATLAAALVGLQVGLLTNEVFNSVVVLMLVTSLLGPVLTERFAARLPRPLVEPELVIPESEPDRDRAPAALSASPPETTVPFSVLVPVANPLTERYLIEVAALLARHESGTVVPLAVARGHVHMDDPQLDLDVRRAEGLLQHAVEVCREFNAPVQTSLRIDDDVPQRISCTAREKNAGLVVMGWSGNSGLRARLFGNLIDSVFWSSHCPVAVMRLLDEPVRLQRVLVPVENTTPETLRAIQFALLFADSNQGDVTLLWVCDRNTPVERGTRFEAELANVLDRLMPSPPSTIETIFQDDVAQTITSVAQSYDIVILRSQRRRTNVGLAVSDVTTQAISNLPGSFVLFGEPHS